MSKTSHLLSKQNSQQPKLFRGGEKKVMKKSLSLLVAIAMVFSMFATVVSAAEQTAGEKLLDLGVIKGTSEGLAEDAEWLRQDITVLIARLLGKEEAAKATENTHGFTDLDSKFYNGFVSWAKTEGYFTGEKETVFGVNNPITNQQFAAVLLRVLKVEVAYADAFEKAVELKLVSADLVKTDNAVRGEIYSALVTALDYKIDGKKLGTILGLKGYEIVDLEVVKAFAPNQKQVTVEFNNDLGAVTAANFAVKKASNDSVQVIQNVTVEGNVATINLIDTLVVDTDYVVTVTNAVDKEATSTLASATADFKYVKAAPVSIEFASTTVVHDSTLAYVIKDAEGNNITPNYTANDVTSVSSNTAVITAGNGTITVKPLPTTTPATDEAYAIVSAKIINTELTTGDKIIYVKRSLNTASGIGAVKIASGTDTVSKEDNLFFFKNTLTPVLKAEVLSADGSVSNIAPTFKSLNPTVVVVDQNTGALYQVGTGSATIVINGSIGGKTVTKSVVVTVKDNSAATSMTVDKTTANVVVGSGIGNAVKLTVKDQYGNKSSATGSLKVTSSAPGVFADTATAYTNGEGELLLPAVAQNGAKGTAVLTIRGNDTSSANNNTHLVATVVVNIVDKGTFVGYAVEVNDTTLDLNAADASKKKGPKTVTVKVYEKDSNGNYIKELFNGDGATITETANNNAVSVAANTLVINSENVGTEVITVKVQDVVVGSYTITVVNSKADFVSKVTQNKHAINLSLVTGKTNVFEALFKDGAFVAHDQYGAKTEIKLTDVKAFSSDEKVVKVDSAGAGGTVSSITAVGTGNATLTVLLGGQVYTVTVVVNP